MCIKEEIMGFRQPFPQSHRWIMSSMIGGACVVAGIMGTGAALAQDPSALAPADVISARKTLMNAIARNMYTLDEMVYTGKFNLPRGRNNADSISAMLQAFPFLFPPSTNTWVANAPRDPAADTFTDPKLWSEYGFFYKEAQAAAKYAYNASRAETEAEFRKSVTELRLTCDTCHATFQKNN
jgi:cytochrome c556